MPKRISLPMPFMFSPQEIKLYPFLLTVLGHGEA